jgi:hypothetical protein
MDVTSTSNRRIVVLAGVLAVVAVAGAVWFFLLGGDGEQAAPAEWSPEVVDIATLVEGERRRPFLDPVRVDFLTAEEFAQAVGASPDSSAPADVQRAEQTLQLLRALALAPDDDLEALLEPSFVVALDGNPPARYLPNQRRIVVRGTEMTAEIEVALLAPLSEALHDQHFGVSRASRLDRSRSVIGLRAISAGAGAAVADAVLAERSEADRRTYRDATDPGDGRTSADLFRAMSLLPEVLGAPLVEVAIVDGTSPGDPPGWGVVNNLFGAPPRTELELLQPWAARDGFERIGVPRPQLGEGESVVFEGDFGAASLYLVMGLRADPREALAASLVWAGDTHVVTRDADDRLCVQIAVAGVDGDASDLFEQVMRDWVAATPREAEASVTRDARVVTLRSCDPGSGVNPRIALDPTTVMSLPVSRTSLLADLRADGASRANAVCVADRVLAGIPVTALTDVDTSPEAQALYDILLAESEQACRRV